MADNHVRKYGDPVLRKKCRPVTVFDEKLKKFAEKMFSIMWAANGIGLAAPQAGETRRMFIVDLSKQDFDMKPMVLINPEIESTEGNAVFEEGCLSFPGLYLEIERPAVVVVNYQDIDGNRQSVEATGLAARAILHEYDHLEGVLFIDHISAIDRDLLAGRLKKIKVG